MSILQWKKKVFILTQNPLVLYYAMWFKNRSKFPFNMWNQLSPCGNVTELQLSWCIMEEQRQSKLLWSIKEEEENNKGILAHSKSNSQSLVSGSRGMLWEEVASQSLAGQTHVDFLPSRFGCLQLPSTGTLLGPYPPRLCFAVSMHNFVRSCLEERWLLGLTGVPLKSQGMQPWHYNSSNRHAWKN